MAALEIVLGFIHPLKPKQFFIHGKSLALRDPELGYRLNPGAELIESGPEFSYHIEINQDGLRDKNIRNSASHSNAIKILIIGDSFAFGVGNEYEDVRPVIFENRLRELQINVDVIKAGVPGYGVMDEFLWLKRIFAKYEPDIVLLAFVTHDIWNISELKNKSYIPKRMFMEMLRESHLYHWFRRMLSKHEAWMLSKHRYSEAAKYHQTPFTEEVTRDFEYLKLLLEEMNEYCQKNSAKLIVLSIPQDVQVIAALNRHEGYDPGMIDQYFLKVADEMDFLWIEGLPVLAEYKRRTNKRLYFPLDQHLNPDGNRVLGNFLAEKVTENVNRT